MARPTAGSPLDGRSASSDERRNLALDICMEWGPELGRPEDVRFHERCTGVDEATATAALVEARAAFSLGCRIVYDDWDESRVSELRSAARAAVEAAHPWVDDENMSRLLSQAAYYGWHG